MDTTIIESAGLTRIEAQVYYALLDYGSAMSGTLSSKTGIHRRTVYDAIERLIKKGLVSYIVQNNRKYFHAENPQRLIQIIKDKETKIQEVIPDLMHKFNYKQETQETLFFRGIQGLKSVFDDQLNSKEILVLGATMKHDSIVKYYFSFFDKKRIEKKIKLKMLFHKGVEAKKYKFAEIKYLPQSYVGNSTIYVYGDKVAIVHWQESPFAVVISQKEIADDYRHYFKLMWSISK